MNEELKPCPFCGSKLREVGKKTGYFNHSNNGCIFASYEFDMAGAPSMVTEWNRRAQLDQAQASAPVTNERTAALKDAETVCRNRALGHASETLALEADMCGESIRALLSAQPAAPAVADDQARMLKLLGEIANGEGRQGRCANADMLARDIRRVFSHLSTPPISPTMSVAMRTLIVEGQEMDGDGVAPAVGNGELPPLPELPRAYKTESTGYKCDPIRYYSETIVIEFARAYVQECARRTGGGI